MRAGTIVASNYVEMAKVLGASFLEHHPAGTFVILVIDDRPVGDVPDGIEIQRLDDLDLTSTELDLMRSIYDVMEFSTAVKPSFLRVMLERDDRCCYLDPDIFVYSNFEDLLTATADEGIVLTPHVLEPIDRDESAPSERTIMQSGIFNLGFIAVGPAARPFLDWWQTRLVYDAVVDIEGGLFTDQRWIDWVPALFDYVRCPDRGMNVAWWNVHERPVSADASSAANGEAAPTLESGEPIRFAHFSGYDPEQPDVFSKHQYPHARASHDETTGIRRLADVYGRQLIDCGHVDRRAESYRWSESECGLPLNPVIRSAIRRGVLEEHRKGVAPDEMTTPFAFGPTAPSLRGWLEEVVGGTEAFPVTRAEHELWLVNADLRFAFRDIDGPDAANYRQWMRVEPRMRAALHDLRAGLPDIDPDGHVDADPGLATTAVRTARRAAGRAARMVRRD